MSKILVNSEVRREADIIVIPDYTQQSQPTNPSDNEVWVELLPSGAIINTWVYDTSNNRWIDFYPRQVSIVHRSVNGSNSTVTYPIDTLPFTSFNCLIDTVTCEISTSLAYTSTTYYAVSILRLSSAATTSVNIHTFNLQNIDATTTRLRLPSVNLNLLTSLFSFTVSHTAFNSPGNIRSSTNIRYRLIR